MSRAVNRIESGDASTIAFKAHRVTLELAAGAWRLDAWLPQSSQGLMRDHRVVGRFTGNLLRNLHVDATTETDEPLGSLDVRTTKERKSVILAVPPSKIGRETTPVKLEFTTNAILLPVHFEFVLERERAKADAKVADEHTESKAEQAGQTAAGAAARRLAIRGSSCGGSSSNSSSLGNAAATQLRLAQLEERFRRLPFEDKVRIARTMESAHCAGWPSLNGACAAEFDNRVGVAEMRRESEHKQHAFDAGLIRPFLLLVSMHPWRRFVWASNLGLNLARDKRFGDAHWEVHQMLFHMRKGIVARAEHTFREKLNPLARTVDWYQLLHRVLFHVMTTKSGPYALLGRERMDAELQASLKQAKVSKSVSSELSSSKELVAAPRHLENLFGKQFYSVRTSDLFNAAGELDTVRVNLDDQDGSAEPITRAELGRLAVELVRQDPELAAVADRLQKHGAEDPVSIAVVALSAFRREALPISTSFCSEAASPAPTTSLAGATEESQPVAAWNKNWGSEAELFNAEFRERVAVKCYKEKRGVVASTSVATVIPAVLAAAAVTPAAAAVVLCSRAAIKAAFPELPCSVAGVLSGIVMQRNWLAVQDIAIEDFYPAGRSASSSI